MAELTGKAINRYFSLYTHHAQQVQLMVLIHRHSADDGNSKGKCMRRVAPDATQSPDHRKKHYKNKYKVEFRHSVRHQQAWTMVHHKGYNRYLFGHDLNIENAQHTHD